MITFWKRCRVSRRFKIQVWDMVIRSKLMYGIETLALTESHKRNLDTCHLNGLRQILKIPTTVVDRKYTSEYVFEQAIIENNLQNRDINKHKDIKQLSTIYEERRIKLLQRVLRQHHQHPMANVSFPSDEDEMLPLLTPIELIRLRVGRPRLRWVETTLNILWHSYCTKYAPELMPDRLNPDSLLHQAHMARAIEVGTKIPLAPDLILPLTEHSGDRTQVTKQATLEDEEYLAPAPIEDLNSDTDDSISWSLTD